MMLNVEQQQTRFMHIAALLLALSLLSSCSLQYVGRVADTSMKTLHLTDNHNTSRSQRWVLHPASKLYLVSTANDAEFDGVSNRDNRPAHVSRLLDKNLYAMFQESFPFTHQSDTGVGLREAFNFARAEGFEFLLYPQVTRYRDSGGAGSGSPADPDRRYTNYYGLDKTLVTLTVFDVHGEQLLDVLRVSSQRPILSSENNLDKYYRSAALHAVSQLESRTAF